MYSSCERFLKAEMCVSMMKLVHNQLLCDVLLLAEPAKDEVQNVDADEN